MLMLPSPLFGTNPGRIAGRSGFDCQPSRYFLCLRERAG
jgi:hypothetical protein